MLCLNAASGRGAHLTEGLRERRLFLGERGQSGYPGKYMLPAGIDVDSDGRVYVVDQFFRKVDVYRPVGAAPLSPPPAGG